MAFVWPNSNATVTPTARSAPSKPRTPSGFKPSTFYSPRQDTSIANRLEYKGRPYIVHHPGVFSRSDRGGEISKRNGLPRSERPTARGFLPRATTSPPFPAFPAMPAPGSLLSVALPGGEILLPMPLGGHGSRGLSVCGARVPLGVNAADRTQPDAGTGDTGLRMRQPTLFWQLMAVNSEPRSRTFCWMNWTQGQSIPMVTSHLSLPAAGK